MIGKINSVESFATLDGTGIRYEIFFQGCPLRCNVCHNPETWDINGKCENISVQDLIIRIKRFKPYFNNNGGVTLSGGEPLLQIDFLLELVKVLKQEQIHIALDTSGCVLNKKVKKLISQIDLVILDLKHNSEENYKKYTHGSLQQTMLFLNELNIQQVPTWIRTVVIPGINDSEKEIDKYLKLIENKSCVKKYELLAFHTMGFSKYENMGFNNPLINTKALTEEKREQLQAFVNKQLNIS